MKIAIAGCLGRMGLTLMKQVLATPNADLVAGSVREDQPKRRETILMREGLAGLDIAFVTNPEDLFASADAVIDFTTPEHTLALASEAARTGKIHICGTTGLSDAQHEQLTTYAEKCKIIWAPNMAVGVNLVAAMVEKMAATLDPDFDIEVVEMHHRYKTDAPSGTALLFGEAAAAGRKVSLQDKAVRTRDGHTGPREEGTIGFATLRGGDVIGDHTVMFAGDGERIELNHKSSSRHIYATGAVRAALWAKEQPFGKYTMKDVLGL